MFLYGTVWVRNINYFIDIVLGAITVLLGPAGGCLYTRGKVGRLRSGWDQVSGRDQGVEREQGANLQSIYFYVFVRVATNETPRTISSWPMNGFVE